MPILKPELLLRVGSEINSHFIYKMSSYFRTFADKLCEVIFERSLKDFQKYVTELEDERGFDVDLESAFREKEQLNHQRQWIKGNENPA
jgi:hypothetical protein